MSLSPEQQEIYVTIWAKAVNTQMHFNEMSVKSRQFGLAFVAAALGLAIVLFVRGQEFSIWIPYLSGFDLHMTVIIIFASANCPVQPQGADGALPPAGGFCRRSSAARPAVSRVFFWPSIGRA